MESRHIHWRMTCRGRSGSRGTVDPIFVFAHGAIVGPFLAVANAWPVEVRFPRSYLNPRTNSAVLGPRSASLGRDGCCISQPTRPIAFPDDSVLHREPVMHAGRGIRGRLHTRVRCSAFVQSGHRSFLIDPVCPDSVGNEPQQLESKP